ncbi:MAG: 3-oxoacyl-[acyl-carrier-protein] reductase [Bacteroidales bacterium]|nr:3-oxoacyl-[acyl-carrier-protein] reductase [Candidatus Cryptobacteroides onthequi]
MSSMLAGRTAVITGGVRGIGYAIAEKFASEGADLIVTSTRDPETSSAELEKLRSYGGRVTAVRVNVADKNEVEAVVTDAVDRMGGVDILVNNAGITRDGLLLRMSEKEWDDVISVDLKSSFNTIQAVLPFMLRQKSGSIINIASIVGVIGNPGQCNYAAAKAGLMGMSRSLAKEMGPKGIRTNCIAPGFIRTDMTAGMPERMVEEWKSRIALRRPGTPEDVAGVALFLASDMSSYVNGEVINCCGGM